MRPMTSGNINCRKNKNGLSADSRRLSRSRITKCGNAALVNRIVDVFAGTNHLGFFVLKGRLALYGSIKGACRSWALSLSFSFLKYQLAFTHVLRQCSKVLSPVLHSIQNPSNQACNVICYSRLLIVICYLRIISNPLADSDSVFRFVINY